MCKISMRVNAVSDFAPRYYHIPCGKCETCRSMQHNSWYVRLASEVQSKVLEGWQVGFVTLSYNNDNLPFLPNDVFKDDFKDELFSSVACFNRNHCRNFLCSLRKWLHKSFGVKGLVYMLCSEFGEVTRRPHYHALFCFPSCVNAFEFYEKIRQFWHYGFVFPKNYEGDEHHNPFLVKGDSLNACFYTAKYVCKDLYFYDSLPSYVDLKNKVFRKIYAPFHLQSRSLGLSFINSLSESQKQNLILNGVSLLGKDKLLSVPLYFRNKLVFDNYYVFDELGKRLCRRKASAFFEKNVELIFRQKVKFVKRLMDSFTSVDFWSTRGMSVYSDKLVARAKSVLDVVPSLTLAKYYCAYYGVPYRHCYKANLKDVYLNRYKEKGVVLSDDLISYADKLFYEGCCNLLLDLDKYFDDRFKVIDRMNLDRVRDFHKGV